MRCIQTDIQVLSRLCVAAWCLMAGIAAVNVNAQSAPQYSLQMMDRYSFNPAFAGMESSLSITGNYRSQWVGIPGNPVQKYVNAHMPLYLWKGAVGMSLQQESIGAQKLLNAMVSYNYVLETNIGLVSAGLAAGISQQSLDGGLLRAPDGDYEGPTILHNDPVLPETVVHGIAPMFSAGVYFAGDEFEGGIALTGYTPGTVKLDQVQIKDRAVLNFFAEYFIGPFQDFKLYPTIFIQSDLIQTQTNVAIRLEYKDFMTFGTGLRGYSGNTLDAVMIWGGLRISQNMQLLYGYDLSLSALSKATEGSHEVMLRYNLNKVIGAGLPPPVIYSPRFYNTTG